MRMHSTCCIDMEHSFFFFLISVNKKNVTLGTHRWNILRLAKILKYHYYPEPPWLGHVGAPVQLQSWLPRSSRTFNLGSSSPSATLLHDIQPRLRDLFSSPNSHIERSVIPSRKLSSSRKFSQPCGFHYDHRYDLIRFLFCFASVSGTDSFFTRLFSPLPSHRCTVTLCHLQICTLCFPHLYSFSFCLYNTTFGKLFNPEHEVRRIFRASISQGPLQKCVWHGRRSPNVCQFVFANALLGWCK
ncbi:hypothetical protein M407DRAFT_137327 [Tulasnella calospora MUT 4182]|uniref:Uncharacterized protein n=1 Tax=Tulasnella calospora MUT 4182 TaxID=1051891 RepID=A0A0C3LG50_9AGAM|nr:hypothetical protein M407DRAFT_137327 [Tulasnella calospora MUT 4182]